MADNPNDILKPRIKYTPQLPKVDPNLLLHAEDLLHYYSFDLGPQSATIVLQRWAETYSVQWIRLAIIEALYQGRYKAVSVAQILQLWQRRQQAQPRFDPEFEKLICEKLPRKLLLRNSDRQNSDHAESAIAALAAEIHANTIHPNAAARIAAASAENGTSTQEAALAALARVVQNRKALQPSVNAVINQVEANVETMAAQAKQQVIADGVRNTIALHPSHSQAKGNPADSVDRAETDRAADRPELGIAPELTPALSRDFASPPQAIAPPCPEFPLTAIHQFTPNPLSPELLAKWKAVSTPPQTQGTAMAAPITLITAPFEPNADISPSADIGPDIAPSDIAPSATPQSANGPSTNTSTDTSTDIRHPSTDIGQNSV
jgi:hypothetical protein